MTLTTFAAEQGHLLGLSINLLPAGRSAANLPHDIAAVDGRDRQAEEWTIDRS